MNAPNRLHRNWLVVTNVSVLLLLANFGPVLAQAEPHLAITAVDTDVFRDIRVLVSATEGDSQRRPDLEGLTLPENDAPVEEYEVAESPFGIELFIAIDANSDIESHDDAGGSIRRVAPEPGAPLSVSK